MAEEGGGLPVGRDLLGYVAGHQLPGHILARQEVKLSTSIYKSCIPSVSNVTPK